MAYCETKNDPHQDREATLKTFVEALAKDIFILGPIDKVTFPAEQPYDRKNGIRVAFDDPDYIYGIQDYVKLAKGFGLIVSDMTSVRDTHLNVLGASCVTFHFRVSGESKEVFGKALKLHRSGPACTIWIQPEGVARKMWVPQDNRWRAATITCSRQYIIDSLKIGRSDLATQFSWLKNEIHDEFFVRSLPMTTEMIRATLDLVECNYKGELRRFYCHAKAMELMCAGIDSLLSNSDETEHQSVHLSAKDAEKIEQAKSILNLEFKDPPTLVRLASRVGLNRNKLAHGFKYIFGVPPMEYCFGLRMEMARDILRDGEDSIAIVADAVGYSEPGSLTKAFKAYFGSLPSDVRRGSKTEVGEVTKTGDGFS